MVQLRSTSALSAGASESFVMERIANNASVAVTAIPGTGDVNGQLAIENLRTVRGIDASGDPFMIRVVCNVRNVGPIAVSTYVVNYSVMTP